MKKLFLLVLCLALVACGSKKTETTESMEWKQMDDFHMIMAESFHPYKDSANLAPAKEMAKELSDAAAQWASAELPEKVNNEDMKAALQQLSSDSQGLLQLVNESAADSLVANSLTKLHDTFHKIQEGWYGSEKRDGHEHH